MTAEPSYDELKERVRELETISMQFEKKLHDVRSLSEEVMAYMSEGFVMTDTRTSILFMNNCLAEMLGCLPDEAVGKSWLDFVPAGQQSVAENAEIRRSRGCIDRYEIILQRKTGETFPALISAGPRFDKMNGQYMGSMGVVTDITERRRMEAALRESEEKYRILFENTGEALFVAQDGRIVFQNPRSIELSGYSAEEFQSRPFADFIHEDDREMVMDNHLRRLRNEKLPERYIFRIIHKNGRIMWVQLNAVVIRWNEKPATLNFMSDITEQKYTEQKLVREVTRSHILMEQSRDGIVILDQAGQVIESNRRFADMLGYPFESMNQLTVFDWEFQHPTDRINEMINSVDEKGHHFETIHQRKDGSVYNVEISTNAAWFDGQKLIFCVCRDITTRKHAEAALRESESKFRSLVEQAAEMLFLHDLKGNLIDVNLAAAKNTGYSKEELQTMTVFDIDPDARDRDDMRKYWESLELEDPPVIFEVRHRRKNGSVYPAEVTSSKIALHDGRYILGLARDITERKQAEAEREKLREQLKQAQKMEAVGRLAGGVAHDFNNMLGIIIGHADMILEELTPDQPFYDDLTEIRKAGTRSADLTRQLLAFARKQTVAPRVIDLNRTVEGMLKMLRRLIGEDIDMAWIPAEKVWPVKIDPGQVDQILANLCVNARDAISGVGKVTIETGNICFDKDDGGVYAGFVPGEYAMLAVSDNGCGMDAEVLSHVFEPFFTTKELGKGTGLGLATVYGAVKQNNGMIDVHSEPGQGTTFRIYLPRHSAKTAHEPGKKADQTPEHGRATVLLVEDEPAILRMAAMMLEREGYTVVAAGTPGEAIRLANEYTGDIHLLMTDVVMPEMNGRDLAKNILSLYPRLKCLFMSGYTANVIAHHGVLDEGVNFIQKPFSKKDLTVKIREIIDKTPDEL